MSTNVNRTQEGTDVPGAAGAIAAHAYIGRDAAGYDHHLDRTAYVIHRIDPETGNRDRVSELRDYCEARDALVGNAIAAYIHAYIGANVGWADRPYVTADELLGGL